MLFNNEKKTPGDHIMCKQYGIALKYPLLKELVKFKFRL